MEKTIIRIFVMLAFTAWVFPQSTAEQSLRRYLFSPQFLRRHQHELQMTKEQRTYIVQQINQAQSEFTPMQWRLEDEIRKLSNLVENRAADEAAIIEQLDTVLDLEKQIKRQQLLLAVRIRNKLSEDQLRKLRDLRMRSFSEPRPQRRNPNRNRDDLP